MRVANLGFANASEVTSLNVGPDQPGPRPNPNLIVDPNPYTIPIPGGLKVGSGKSKGGRAAPQRV